MKPLPDSNDEANNCHLKYLNLRKLNSNRAQKLNYLTQPKYQSMSKSVELKNFLDYFNLIEVVNKENKKDNRERLIEIQDQESECIDDDNVSKIDYLIKKPNYPEHNEVENFSKFLIQKTTKDLNCVFDYLIKIGAFASPNESFLHIQSYLKAASSSIGLKCELVYEKHYWPVKIKKFLNNLYLLKFLKIADNDLNESVDSNTSITHDIASMQILFEFENQALLKNLKPIGWSKKRNFTIKKPDLNSDVNDLNSLIARLGLKDTGKIEIKEFFEKNKPDNELVEIIDHNSITFGKIKRNWSGRVELSILGSESYLYYFLNDPYLKQFGWSKKFEFEYKNRNFLNKEDTCAYENIKCNKADSIDDNLPIRKNFLIEVLYENKFFIGCVVEVCNNEFLRIKLDARNSKFNNLVLIFFIDFKNRAKNVAFLYPCKWCEKNNLSIEEPSDWPNGIKFDWDEYVRIKCMESQYYMVKQNFNLISPRNGSTSNLNVTCQSDHFKVGQYLEVSLSKTDKWIYLAKIKAKLGNLLFVKVYSDRIFDKNKLYIFTNDSCNLYPIGWSQINNYEYYDNSFLSRFSKSIKFDPNNINFHPSFLKFIQSDDEYCENIYINSIVNNCGPFFIKAKLSELPSSFGPGPIFLVLFKLLQNLLNISEKPFKLLKILHKKSNETLSSKSFRRLRLKAKEKGKYMFKEIEICSTNSQLNEFLKNLCTKLSCCTRMISVDEYSESDPYLESNQNLAKQIKCCLLCTINYFSSPCLPKVVDETKTNDEPVKPRVKNLTKKLKSEAISSPIKTRLNTRRQIFLQNIRQIRKEEAQEVKTEDSDDEPLIKKTKKLNQQMSQSTSSLLTKPFDGAKIDLNNTLPSNLKSPTKIKTSQNNLIISTGISVKNQNSILNVTSNGSNGSVMFNNKNNPILWTKKEVEQYLIDNKFDLNLVYLIEEHEIDGQSFLMLNLPTIQNYMNLKLGPAIKLAHLVEKLKIFYFEKYQK